MKIQIHSVTIDHALRETRETREPPTCAAHRSKVTRASSIFHGLTWYGYFLCLTFLLCSQPSYSADKRNPHGSFQLACESCHTTISWRPIRSKLEFDHNHDTRYPLRGLHEGVACTSCHRSLIFNNVGTKCADCHADIHRRQFGPRCEDCHTVQGWKVNVQSVRNHFNRFPLLGAHAAVDCDSCHPKAATGVYIGLSTDCVSCHLKDYQSASSPNHASADFPLTCQTCHGVDRWQGAKFNHAQVTGFALVGAHVRLDCSSCHKGQLYKGTPRDCFGCHAQDYNRTSNPNHVAANFPKDCAICHDSEHWQGVRFDHSQTGFALTGAHITARCDTCHVAGRYKGTPRECFSCHAKDFEGTLNPDHRKANISTQCDNCHTTTNWQGAKFDHSKARFALTGAHLNVNCAQCHVNGQFTGTPMDCFSCHQSDYSKTTSPNHQKAGFSQNCATCHTTQQWKGAKFDHNNTKFALTGAHVSVNCAQCHVGGRFAGTPTSCISCHSKDFDGTTSPNHRTANFPQDCTVCHTTQQWKGAKFDHTKTRFPLTGAHITTSCAQCHINGVYTGTSTQCVACHQSDYNGTKNPNHVTAGFPKDCAVCHTTTGWKSARFDHNSTRFPLTGSHTSVSCDKCHVGGQYTGTTTQCFGCHKADYNSTTNPNHTAAGFPQDCTVCHNTVQWKGAHFDHNGATKFPLTGAHITVSCSQCHLNNRFAGTPSDCVSCHQADYNGSTNPNHKAAGFPQTCATCHTTAQWKGARFDHSTASHFPLTGAHVNVACTQCHANNRFAGTPTDCASCHLNVFNGTTNPNHVTAGFPKDCSLCHTTTAWPGAKFDHSQTKFPLTGAHVSLTCNNCHSSGKYAGLGTSCVTCHLKDFNATTNPNHAAAGFPQDCQTCHSTTQWKGAVFDHSKTRFPLTGAHRTVTCVSCHIGGRYAGTPMDCYGCHRTVYETVSNPNHLSAGFPKTCETCHTTSTWTGATFNHKFPIYSGTHRGKWTTCNDCHTNPANYTLFSCTNCHAHDKTPMDQKHSGVRNYVYNSVNCYACHPTGSN